MGLDTFACVKGKEEEFIRKCQAWLGAKELMPEDVDLWLEDSVWGWDHCNSRILSRGISEIIKSNFQFSNYDFDKDFNFYQNLSAVETLQIGERVMGFLEKAIKDLPDDHKIPGGYVFKVDEYVPSRYHKTKDFLDYFMRLARWFIMVGECGFSTRASY